MSQKLTSIFLSAFLTLCNDVGYASTNLVVPARKIPDIKIPSELGRVEESYTGNTGKTVIYIQDAHDSLEAQVNIAKLIQDFVNHHGVKTVFEEGYEGPVPSDEYFSFIDDPKIKEKVSYILMDKLRIGGAEYAHINRKRDFSLIGADNIKLHLENIRWYQQSAKDRKKNQKELQIIRTEVDRFANQFFPQEIKDWIKLRKRFNEKELGLLDYLKRTMSSLSLRQGHPLRQASGSAHNDFAEVYPNLALLLKVESTRDREILEKAKAVDPEILFKEMNRLEDDFAGEFLSTERARRIFQYQRNLERLERLSAIQLMTEEYDTLQETLHEFNTQKAADFIASEGHRSVALSKKWEEGIENSIQFYKVARRRERAIEIHLRKFAGKTDEKVCVLIFGGFHKEQIRQMLRKKGFSYFVLTPRISALDSIHQAYYHQLMARDYSSLKIPPLVSRASTPLRPLEILKMGGTQQRSEFRSQIMTIKNALQRISEQHSLDKIPLDILSRLVDQELSRSEHRSKNSVGVTVTRHEGLLIVKIEGEKTISVESLDDLKSRLESLKYAQLSGLEQRTGRPEILFIKMREGDSWGEIRWEDSNIQIQRTLSASLIQVKIPEREARNIADTKIIQGLPAIHEELRRRRIAPNEYQKIVLGYQNFWESNVPEEVYAVFTKPDAPISMMAVRFNTSDIMPVDYYDFFLLEGQELITVGFEDHSTFFSRVDLYWTAGGELRVLALEAGREDKATWQLKIANFIAPQEVHDRPYPSLEVQAEIPVDIYVFAAGRSYYHVRGNEVWTSPDGERVNIYNLDTFQVRSEARSQNLPKRELDDFLIVRPAGDQLVDLRRLKQDILQDGELGDILHNVRETFQLNHLILTESDYEEWGPALEQYEHIATFDSLFNVLDRRRKLSPQIIRPHDGELRMQVYEPNNRPDILFSLVIHELSELNAIAQASKAGIRGGTYERLFRVSGRMRRIEGFGHWKGLEAQILSDSYYRLLQNEQMDLVSDFMRTSFNLLAQSEGKKIVDRDDINFWTGAMNEVAQIKTVIKREDYDALVRSMIQKTPGISSVPNSPESAAVFFQHLFPPSFILDSSLKSKDTKADNRPDKFLEIADKYRKLKGKETRSEMRTMTQSEGLRNWKQILGQRLQDPANDRLIEDIIEIRLGIPKIRKAERPIRILDLGTERGEFLNEIRGQLKRLGYPVEAVGIEREEDRVDQAVTDGVIHAEMLPNGVIQGLGRDAGVKVPPYSFDLIFMNAPTLQRTPPETENSFQIWFNVFGQYAADHGLGVMRRAMGLDDERDMIREEAQLSRELLTRREAGISFLDTLALLSLKFPQFPEGKQDLVAAPIFLSKIPFTQKFTSLFQSEMQSQTAVSKPGNHTDVFRSEMRRSPSLFKSSLSVIARFKGNFLIKAEVLAALKPEQRDELFSRLFMNRSELRLIVFDEHGQISPHNPALNAILQLPNVRLTAGNSYEGAAQKYGIPKSVSVFLTADETFRRALDPLIKAVLLKNRPGEIEFARLLVINGGVLPGVQEKNGVFDPSAELLARIEREEIARTAVAYAA